MTIQPAKTLWETALGQLQLQVTRPNYETWLKKTVGIALNDGEFIVGAPNTFVAEMLEQRMYSMISQAVDRVADGPMKVRFQVMSDESHADAPATTAATNDPTGNGLAGGDPGAAPNAGNTDMGLPSSPGVMPLPGYQTSPHRRVPLNPAFTFSTFVVGVSNELAHAAALAVSENPGGTYNPLFLNADVGLGKTHLLHAIGHALLASGRSLIYSTTEEFTNEYIKAIREGTTEEFRDHYRSADVLLLDDIQFIIGKEQTQEGFFHTFNALHMSGRQVVITSDRPLTALTLLEKRVRSRLAGGLVVDIQSPDLETRLAILAAKAELTGEDFAPGVFEFLAERIHKNIRDLEGCLNRVVAYARLGNARITLDLVKRAIADILQPSKRHRISDRHIIDNVSSYFGIEADALMGRRRDKPTAHARQITMYLLREEAHFGYTAIGRALGGRDHTTAIHACNRITKLLDTDNHVRQDILNIRESLFALAPTS